MTELEAAERETRLSRIRRVSAAMKYTVTVMLVLIIVFGVMITTLLVLPYGLLPLPDETIDTGDLERSISEIPQLQRFGFALLSAAACGLLVAACWTLRQVFQRFQRLEFFSPSTLSSIISFGVWLIVFAVFEFVSEPVVSILLTYDLPEGERAISIDFDGGETFIFVLGALMLVFGWILREAAVIADENRQFI